MLSGRSGLKREILAKRRWLRSRRDFAESGDSSRTVSFFSITVEQCGPISIRAEICLIQFSASFLSVSLSLQVSLYPSVCPSLSLQLSSSAYFISHLLCPFHLHSSSSSLTWNLFSLAAQKGLYVCASFSCSLFSARLVRLCFPHVI